MKQLLSCVAAAVAVGIVYCAFYIIVEGGDLATVPVVFMVATAVALTHSVVLGMPVAWWLERRGRLTRTRVFQAAFVIGAIPVPLALLITAPGVWVAAAVLGCGVLGLLGGLVWWVVNSPVPLKVTPNLGPKT